MANFECKTTVNVLLIRFKARLGLLLNLIVILKKLKVNFNVDKIFKNYFYQNLSFYSIF